jgi:hypothetical protein
MEDQFGNKNIFVPCDCGAEILGITHAKKDKYWTIVYNEDKFYSLQDNGWDIFKHRISFIWKILTGKEYTFFEIIVNDKNMQELMDFVKENM